MTKKEKMALEINRLEISLYQTKWFDYRTLRPHACNIAFILAMATEGTIHHDLMGNTKYKSFVNKLDLNRYNEWRWKGHINNLRIFADTHGIPYNIYWQFSYRVFRSSSGFKVESLASYSTKYIKEEVLKCWNEFGSSILIKSDAEMFNVDLYKKTHIQDEYFDFLFDRIVKKYGQNELGFQNTIKRMVEDKEIPVEYLMNRIKNGGLCGRNNG